MLSIVCYATAQICGRVEAIVAACRDALALASDRVEEVAILARRGHALAAAAAVLVPGLGLVAGDVCRAVAHARAGIEVPVVVGRALLEHAHAGAFFRVPVMSVTQASLRSAFPRAGVGVKHESGMLLPVSLVEFGSALTRARFVVEVLERIALSS